MLLTVIIHIFLFLFCKLNKIISFTNYYYLNIKIIYLQKKHHPIQIWMYHMPFL